MSEAVPNGISIENIAEAIVGKLDEKDQARTFHTDHAFVDWLDKRIGDKLRLWAAGIILAYSVPIVLAAYYIGGMNEKLDAALNDQRMNTQSLQARGSWMNDQERFNCEVRRAITRSHPDSEIGICAFVTGQDRTDSRR